jgi:quercetin dioxygenase-like cupin family protein
VIPLAPTAPRLIDRFMGRDDYARLSLLRGRLCVLVAALGLAPGSTGCSRHGPPGAAAAPVQWIVPPVLPPGALISIVSGDPTRSGEFTLLVSMPDGYRIPPHSHPSDEHVEVKEGTLLVGTGDRLDPKMTQTLTAGDSGTAPSGARHFSIAKGRTLLLATFMGPYTITYVRAEDAPKPRSFPFGY